VSERSALNPVPGPPEVKSLMFLYSASFLGAQRAVSEWSALNPDQKKAYGEAYRAAHPELAAGGEGEGGGDDAAAMEAQAQLLLDGAAEAHQAAGTKRKVPGWSGTGILGG